VASDNARVFVSYQYREKELAQSLAAPFQNANDDLDYYDMRMRVQVASDDAEPIKKVIAQKIDQAQSLLCIVGPTTATSSWINWEIDYAKSKGKGLVAVQMPDSTLPTPIEGSGATILSSENPDIQNAVRQAL
jgi:hypothetical protein